MRVSLSGTKNYIETDKILINHFMNCSSSRTWDVFKIGEFI